MPQFLGMRASAGFCTSRSDGERLTAYEPDPTWRSFALSRNPTIRVLLRTKTYCCLPAGSA